MKPALLLALAFAAALSAGGELLRWQQTRAQATPSFFKLLLGESRRAFADQMFLKADGYYHMGNYPSVFDLAQAQTEGKTHLAKETEGHDQHDHAQPPLQRRDWIEAFGNHFRPTGHRHLDGIRDGREILPWLRLSAELDPHRVDSYTVAAYWLRERMNRLPDAEAFLRQGLRANPGSYEILYELGRLYAENNRDVPRARAVFELAIEKWIRQEASQPTPDIHSYRLILGQLASLEEQAGNLERARAHFTRLKHFSPQPEAVQQRIDEVLKKLNTPKPPAPPSPPPQLRE